MEKAILTSSSMACALRCPRKYYYENILGLKLKEVSEALKIGTAIHNGGEARAKGLPFELQYKAAISGATLDEYTAAKVYGILGAYAWHYGEIDDRDYAEMYPEVQFSCPINGSRSFESHGKADGLALLKDGRKVGWERKTTSDDLADTSDYWQRLKLNHQLLTYASWVYSSTGELVTFVYDVIRKPELSPRSKVSEVDENGIPIVVDLQGNRCIKRDGTPKKSADASKGEVIKSHPETADEYGDRILDAMRSDTARYFARREVTITEDMLNEFEVERLQVCRMLLHFASESRKAKLPEYGYPRACNPDNCKFCPFAAFCLTRKHIDAQNVPDGFYIAHHEELNK